MILLLNAIMLNKRLKIFNISNRDLRTIQYNSILFRTKILLKTLGIAIRILSASSMACNWIGKLVFIDRIYPSYSKN
jgi:hypothetical protein